MSPSSSKRPVRGAYLSALPEELLERILDECMSSMLASQVPGSTYATSPYPSPDPSPSISRSSSGQGSSPARPKHSPSRGRDHPPSPSHRFPPLSTTFPDRTGSVSVITPLLVSRLLHRISSPLLYRFITLSSRSRTQKLLYGSLRRHPERACWIRRLIIAGVWQEAGEVLKLVAAATAPSGVPGPARGMANLGIPPALSAKGKVRQVVPNESKGGRVAGLEALEITIDTAPLNLQQRPRAASAGSMHTILGHSGNGLLSSSPYDADADAMCQGLVSLAKGGAGGAVGLKALVLRKPQNVYLTHQRTKMVLSALARVVERTPALETVHIAFRLSDDPRPRALSGPAPRPQSDHGPVVALTTALSLCPHLHTLTTHLPSVWNEALLRMSSNPALERIVLLGTAGMPVTFTAGTVDSPTRTAIPVTTNSRDLPPHPVDRVYTTSVRGCDGYAIASSNGAVPSRGMPAVPGTGIFMNEARKHERLCALVHAGYLAHTLQVHGSPTSRSLSCVQPSYQRFYPLALPSSCLHRPTSTLHDSWTSFSLFAVMKHSRHWRLRRYLVSVSSWAFRVCTTL
ncbi:hypothetical protein BKA70DRAFT_177438 [Coprinopsis sp. MPI-PUGE-AT-0042]|nr:hypothetical protein BKA70DRAFT_177438 [Coprinopsis sp. MPI-PUGE-AT-0042]